MMTMMCRNRNSVCCMIAVLWASSFCQAFHATFPSHFGKERVGAVSSSPLLLLVSSPSSVVPSRPDEVVTRSISSSSSSSSSSRLYYSGKNNGNDDNNPSSKTIAKMGISSILTGVVASLFLFFSVGNVEEALSMSQELSAANGLPVSSSVVVATATETTINRPPPITTTSSPQATALAKSLRKLDATMYSAYWCSHCYEQKQAFGKEAFTNYITYVECSKDGFDAQNKLCKDKNLPGYPTWEIKGKLYPGEQSLEELEEIVQKSL
uniref:Thioredoxin domain-containing protein n=1 Tax=Eucampia antarctica TaxID=49252 RepID=A0A7S2R3K6_9STRA|mmetsp:Transcript_16079/g.15500  ORF Transcript_16079/g.15500 Transcript_16079/m.15500 type:complete len:266 (+) Transcript_16079:29-826(+)